MHLTFKNKVINYVLDSQMIGRINDINLDVITLAQKPMESILLRLENILYKIYFPLCIFISNIVLMYAHLSSLKHASWMLPYF